MATLDDDATIEPTATAVKTANAPTTDALTQSAQLAAKWGKELTASKKWMEKFTRVGEKCEAAYISQGQDVFDRTIDYAGKTNLFWSNVQVILSAIYGRMPRAEVQRKFKDYSDDVSRVAALMLQRILNGDMEREWDDTNAAMRDGVQDRFIAGLGQVWCRYDVDIETNDQPVTDPMTGQQQMDETGQPLTQPVESITNEEAEVDYVYWKDFRYAPCRRWRDCRWVARRVYMSQDKLATRFSLTPEQVAMVPTTTRSPSTTERNSPDEDVLRATVVKQSAVWEIWDKDSNAVYWFVEGCTFILGTESDPLELDEFFPCPMPIVATTLTRAFLPRADYAMAQDLYKELDLLNAKLSNLTRAVKAAGVYDKAAAPVKSLLTNAVENSLIPVDNWSSFVERGGLKGVVDWMPIEAFVNAIMQLNQRKQLLQHDLYEVLGISDIMRGASLASETATAQELKAQYGGARLANLQNEVARFVSEVMRIRANIICNHWQPATIIQRSLIMQTPDAQYAQAAVAMLKDFGTALYSIVVTSDSLAAPDWAAEKEARTEFLGAASNYLMAAAPLVAQAPQIGSFLAQLLQWAAAGFKGAATIEGVLDQFAKQLEQQVQQPPPPPQPTPEDQKNLAQAGKYQAEAKRTSKEAALIPPAELPPPGMHPGAMPMPPGGPQGPPGGIHPAMGPGGPPGAPQGAPGGPPGPGMHPPLPAAPGTVAPMAPAMPQPLNRMQ